MKKSDQGFPYKSLGTLLKRLREKKQQTLAEVSGAVEIDVTTLTDIEQGLERPSEDILLLLISHFAIRDDEATKLWELAGYLPPDGAHPEPPLNGAQPVLVMPMDVRIVYTDMAHIAVNKYGLTMNFMQSGGPGNRPLAVARIGMSTEHAESVLELLQKALQQAKPKLLPAPESKDEASEEKS
jgi:DNA-binding XRE family transcriptional regulator